MIPEYILCPEFWWKYTKFGYNWCKVRQWQQEEVFDYKREDGQEKVGQKMCMKAPFENINDRTESSVTTF